jgi:hypothetical protein
MLFSLILTVDTPECRLIVDESMVQALRWESTPSGRNQFILETRPYCLTHGQTQHSCRGADKSQIRCVSLPQRGMRPDDRVEPGSDGS